MSRICSTSRGLSPRLFFLGALLAAALSPAGLRAQLAAPNASGVSAGHTHLTVPDLQQHRKIWLDFGARPMQLGRLELLAVPGMQFLLIEREPSAPSARATANHIAFTVRDYPRYKELLALIDAPIVLENEEIGQLLADLPGGLRVEFISAPEQSDAIRFHHTHLQAKDTEALRQWYLDVFGAERGERAGMPSAVIPGGRVDFLPARGEAPLPTPGTAIDHIGFEVADMDAFAAHLRGLGIEFSVEPRYVEAIGLTIAFIEDPTGTSIEITHGLNDARDATR